MTSETSILAEVLFDDRGLVPVIAQDAWSGEVLMLAYANKEALRLTLETGRAHYYSRSRAELWRKGDSSGNIQIVRKIAVDCDGDAVLYRIKQEGAACHTGARSCFFRTATVAEADAEGALAAREGVTGDHEAGIGRALALLERVVAERLRDLPDGSYVARLHDRGLGYVAQKVVEEAGETVVAALERREDELISEAADLLFHLTVLLRESGQSLASVAALLEARHRERSDS
ncbi:MAG: bifunctional phosphoribosyl-AMP cyclohydrolase/phosphoribosyl-ATP diphosphatase HisIE [Trueperaceae bacterium]